MKLIVPQTAIKYPQKNQKTFISLADGFGRMGTGRAHKLRLGRVYAAWLYQARWYIIGFWLLAFLASVPLARLAPDVLHNSGYTIKESESSQVNQLLIAPFHAASTSVNIVLQSAHTSVNDPAYQQEIRAISEQVKGLSHVVSVETGEVGRDGCTTVIRVGFDEDNDAVAQSLPTLRTRLANIGTTPAHILLTGEAVMGDAFPSLLQTTTQTAERIALPLSLLALLFIFQSIAAAMIPVILAPIVISIATALIYLLGLHSEINIFGLTLISIGALGFVIDYSLMMIKRFRDELTIGKDVPAALETTLATAGDAILHSGLIVMIGFAGLFWMNMNMMSSLSICGILGTIMTLLATLSLLPALMSVLGKRLNKADWSWLPERRQKGRQQLASISLWQHWGQAIMKRPARMLVLTIGLLCILAWPARTLHTQLADAATLPNTSDAYQGFAILKAQLPTSNESPIVVIAQVPHSTDVLQQPYLTGIQQLTQRIATLPHVVGVTSLTHPPEKSGLPQLSSDEVIRLYESGMYRRTPALAQFVDTVNKGQMSVLLVKTDAEIGSQEDQALIDQIRTTNPQQVQGLHIMVGGMRAFALDFNRTLFEHFGLTLLFILFTSYGLLLFTFRSILLPLKAILMNLISVSAAYGILVFVFQEGHLARWLGFTSTGYIICFIPVLMFCVVFALSMDYEVFLLLRMREEWLRTGNNAQAITAGLEKTGGVITSAALLFIIVTASFIGTPLIVTKELAFGMAIAVLIDATLIRCLLVPATMQLLGKWNWWLPGRRIPIPRTDLQRVNLHVAQGER